MDITPAGVTLLQSRFENTIAWRMKLWIHMMEDLII